MRFLGFYIHVYDDRPELSTLVGNVFADERHLADYAVIGESPPATPGDYVVIMTIGYRTDKIVLRQLLKMPFYLTWACWAAHEKPKPSSRN